MCEPVSLSAIGASIAATVTTAPVATASIGLGLATFAGGVATAVSQQEQAEAAKDAADARFEFETGQINRNLEGQAAQNAQRNFELARQAAEDRGIVQASGLGDRSVRALSRAVGFKLGQDKATVQRNQRIATETAAARLHGARISRDDAHLRAGDTSGATLGLQIGGSVLRGALSGLSTFTALGGSFGEIPPPDAGTDLDIDTTFTDFAVA